MGRIVVGVDGSDGSRQALTWAAEEATLRGVELHVICTYELDVAWGTYAIEDDTMSMATSERTREALEMVARSAQQQAQGIVDRMVDEVGLPNITGNAVQSHHPAMTLVEHSRDADMLVIGSRGRGAFKSLMLGSVSQQCALHAECPVVIIRPHG